MEYIVKTVDGAEHQVRGEIALHMTEFWLEFSREGTIVAIFNPEHVISAVKVE